MNNISVIASRLFARGGLLLLASALPWASVGAIDLRPSITIEVEPGSDTGTFVAAVQVRDLDTSTVLANPTIQFSAGTPGSVDVDLAAQQAKVHVEIMIDTTLTRANWTCSVSSNGQTAFEQTGGVTLRAAVQQGY